MTTEVEEKMYYASKEAAALLRVDYRKLLNWIRDGYLPRRTLGHTKTYIIGTEDFETIAYLMNPDMSPEPIYKDAPVQHIGYTLSELAAAAGVPLNDARSLFAYNKIPVLQEIAGKYLFDESAIEVLRTAPPRSRKRKPDEERVHVEKYEQGVPPLSEREKRVLELYGDGHGPTLEEIGRSEWGIKRQAVHALYSRAQYKQQLLAEGAKPFVSPAKQPRQPRLEKKDKAILQRVLEGKRNAEIARDLAKNGLTEATVQQRVRKWARYVEGREGEHKQNKDVARYVLRKYGVLQDEQTAT